MRTSENFVDSTVMKIIVFITLIFKIQDKSSQKTWKMYKNGEDLLLIQSHLDRVLGFTRGKCRVFFYMEYTDLSFIITMFQKKKSLL